MQDKVRSVQVEVWLSPSSLRPGASRNRGTCSTREAQTSQATHCITCRARQALPGPVSVRAGCRAAKRPEPDTTLTARHSDRRRHAVCSGVANQRALAGEKVLNRSGSWHLWKKGGKFEKQQTEGPKKRSRVLECEVSSLMQIPHKGRSPLARFLREPPFRPPRKWCQKSPSAGA